MNGLAVGEEDHAEIMLLLWNVYPSANPAIPLDHLS
jgi:hypothetical protein